MNTAVDKDALAQVEFTLNGPTSSPCRARPLSRRQSASALRCRTSATRKAIVRTAIAGHAWCEIKGERVLAPSCCRVPAAGNGGQDRQRARQASQKMVLELLLSDMPGAAVHPSVRARSAGRRSLVASRASLRVQQAAGRPLACRDRGESRFMHSVHALRARLPRGADERRHRLRVSRRALEDRVRSRRSDGRRAPASPAANVCRRVRPAR